MTALVTGSFLIYLASLVCNVRASSQLLQEGLEPMPITSSYPLGVVMSYYGPVWSDTDIASYADFCSDNGFDFFLYAPKLDPYLREKWAEPLPETYMTRFKDLKYTFSLKGVAFGMAISIFNLAVFNATQEAAFIAKIEQLNSIGIDVLGVFFDDVSDSLVNQLGENLAPDQVKIGNLAASHTTAKTLFTVPTYYSHDDILTRVLGPMPHNYLESFGQIDSRYNIFWTGEHIIASGFENEELNAVASRLGRKPFLWDNYPVNDDFPLCSRVRIFGFTGREYTLTEAAQGHASNPMRYAWLSKIPLGTLSDVYTLKSEYDPRTSYLKYLAKYTEGKPNVAQLVDQELVYLSDQGVLCESGYTCTRLTDEFANLSGHVAEEVHQFLTYVCGHCAYGCPLDNP